jgi:hypothetical protein
VRCGWLPAEAERVFARKGVKTRRSNLLLREPPPLSASENAPWHGLAQEVVRSETTDPDQGVVGFRLLNNATPMALTFVSLKAKQSYSARGS